MSPGFLVELRAALAAGATPTAALATVAARSPEDEAGPRVAQGARLGVPLTELAEQVGPQDPGLAALLRALALSELTGAAGAVAVDQGEATVRAERDLQRLLDARTAQARGTALVLSVLPLAAWGFLVALDRSTLDFYTTPLGLGCGLLALSLWAAGHRWSRAIVRAAASAGSGADPVAPAPPAAPVGRVVAVAAPAALVAGVMGGVLVGLLFGVVAAAVARRQPGRRGQESGGAAEAVELLAASLAAGLSTPAALAATAGVAPAAARPVLERAARRLSHGWAADDLLAGTGLAEAGTVLAACARWGAPAAPALAALADDLRARRRLAAETAAERAQLRLVFPTTLLTLPSFVVATVPPLLWTAFTG